MNEPWHDSLPTTMKIHDSTYKIEYDYRVILDILELLSDPELNNQEKAIGVLHIFYPNIAEMQPEHYKEAIEYFFWFLNGGEEDFSDRRTPRLVSWKQDF